MRKVFYGFLSLFLLVSCTNHAGQGARIPDICEESIAEDAYFVSESEAQAIATDFFDGSDVTLIGTDHNGGLRSIPTADAGLPSYYIFTTGDRGFVIISASETAYPILGYSATSSIDLQDMPDGLRYLLGIYSGNVNTARRGRTAPSESMRRLRKHLKLRAKDSAGKVKVQPLLNDIEWDQSPYYNALTPDPQVPIGCVATATSQILRYWKYPDKAVGHHQYTSRMFGDISFDFNHTFDWGKMPAATLNAPNKDIAILCYGVAVAINTNFNYSYDGGSSAIHRRVPYALYRHYGYPKSLLNVHRSNYDDATWTAMVKKELDNHRPVQYGGSGDDGGHSFVIDGYDSTDLFHVNWGWGGISNGWFKLNAMNPDDLGTGGGAGEFNKDQDMIINFAPPAHINGDQHDAVPDDSEEDSNRVYDNGVKFDDIYVFNPLDFFIRYTSFGNVVTTSNGRGYSTHFTKNITVAAGGTLPYAVEVNVNEDDIRPKIAIYIDFDDNGKFDLGIGSTEKVAESPAGQFAPILKGTYNVPATAPKGMHRMRVVTSNLSTCDPNAFLPNGEIEDYYITIE